MQTKVDAQKRADRIAQFRSELTQLETDGILALDDTQKRILNDYHEGLLHSFSSTFDVDVNAEEKQLSLGMKVASFLGALAFGASLFFLFYQFWGFFSTAAQVAVLTISPLCFLLITYGVSQKESTGYFAKISGLICAAAFVLNLVMLGQIFNLESSNTAFLVWSILGLLLAYASDARLLLAAAIIAFGGFLSAQVGTWGGCYWLHFGERPENFLPAGLIILLLGFLPHRCYTSFPQIFRVFGLLFIFIPALILSNWGWGSYFVANLFYSEKSVEAMYQLAGFLFSGLVIWLGIRKHWADVTNTGNIFFVIFLYTKFFDWWWKLIPKYLFFLLIGCTSLLTLLVFRRLRLVHKAGRANA